MKKVFFAIFTVFALSVLLCGCGERTETVKIIISFDSCGGTKVGSAENAVECAPKSEKDGCLLEGWYKDSKYSERAVFPFAAGKSATLYARWVVIAEGNTETAYSLNSDGKGYTAVAYDEQGLSVCVPDTYKNLPVTKIAGGFLMKKNYLTAFYIGCNVTETDETFYRCASLEKFIAGDSGIYTEENGVLYENGKLVCFPPALNSASFSADCEIGDYAFSNARYLNSLSLGASVIRNDKAFANMTALQSITVNAACGAYSAEDGILYSADGSELVLYPRAKSGASCIVKNGTEKILDSAFYGDGIKELTIPATLTYFGDVSYLTSLENIYVADGNAAYVSDGGALYSSDGKTLYRCPAAKSGVFEVKDGTETIAPFCFANAVFIGEIRFPSSLTAVEQYAFFGCCGLKKAVFADESLIEKIAESAFADCMSLEELVMTARVAPETGENLFSSVKSGFRVTVPANAGEYYLSAWNFASGYISANGLDLAEYTVTFDSRGGTEAGAVHSAYVFTAPESTREGYVFLGWYTDPTGAGKAVSFPYAVYGHITLYAAWDMKLSQ